MGSFQAWVSEHKLAGVGTLWAAALVASLAYSRKRSPHKASIRLIHARMHAQALTLAVLSGAALKHYYETQQKLSPLMLSLDAWFHGMVTHEASLSDIMLVEIGRVHGRCILLALACGDGMSSIIKCAAGL